MKKTIYLFSVLGLIGIGNIYAQSSITSSGIDASGPNGSISYSVGVMDIGNASNSSGNLNSGTQQPYEIFILSGINNKTIEVNFNAYPNPTSDLLNIVVNQLNNTALYYNLSNSNGASIYNGNISLKTTSFNLKELTAGVYFLSLRSNNQEIKNIKIIKN